jgi:hypothetical protein
MKSTKEEFAYVEPAQNPKCETCNRFVSPNACTLVKGKIDGKNGVCAFWGKGKNDEKITSEPEFTKEQSLYVEVPGSTKCGTCYFFSLPNRCKLVKGNINGFKGCCIAWKSK